MPHQETWFQGTDSDTIEVIHTGFPVRTARYALWWAVSTAGMAWLALAPPW